MNHSNFHGSCLCKYLSTDHIFLNHVCVQAPPHPTAHKPVHEPVHEFVQLSLHTPTHVFVHPPLQFCTMLSFVVHLIIDGNINIGNILDVLFRNSLLFVFIIINHPPLPYHHNGHRLFFLRHYMIHILYDILHSNK